jgi:hypothetical protein
LQISRNISKEFISHGIKKFKLLWENGFKNSLKISTVTGSNNLFSTGSIVSHERETMWKNEVYTTKHILRAIFCVLFHFNTSSGRKHTNTEALLPKHPLYIFMQLRGGLKQK